MTPQLRMAGIPSPLAMGTHVADALAPRIPFDEAAAGSPVLAADTAAGSVDLAADDELLIGEAMAAYPGMLTTFTRMIRPISVGALMAIPTVGAATVGLVAMVNPAAGMAMATTSVAFLAGLPTDIIVLIGTLATGYGFAKSVERIKGARV